ncbi:uncharacterized protein B0H18DRAFT_218648 [Fomitopsis serialis]|uniref:uncharacterized protein n=1 Tax=Fomitopsis serialis TaxID=139415 RepID=UPI002007DF8A|nr:uncharacterized protein B0H18DRAFT_218648 [Neoantrodia serialis]KAH9913023.1 hypothetical protein B0H18DRAFT_218648 [Neoantrodia serialis]
MVKVVRVVWIMLLGRTSGHHTTALFRSSWLGTDRVKSVIWIFVQPALPSRSEPVSPLSSQCRMLTAAPVNFIWARSSPASHSKSSYGSSVPSRRSRAHDLHMGWINSVKYDETPERRLRWSTAGPYRPLLTTFAPFASSMARTTLDRNGCSRLYGASCQSVCELCVKHSAVFAAH